MPPQATYEAQHTRALQTPDRPPPLDPMEVSELREMLSGFQEEEITAYIERYGVRADAFYGGTVAEGGDA